MDARKSFHQQLDDLYSELVRMSGQAVETVERTREAFWNLDPDLAGRIIEDDDRLDEHIVNIEENGIDLIATQAPVAIDLRTIFVIMKLAMHFERVGDLCVNICKAVRNMGTLNVSLWTRDNINEMFTNARRMLERAMESFRKKDVAMAEELSLMDDAVDRINRAFITGANREDEAGMESVVRVVMIARFLERIADHAVDIGENVRYMVTGQFQAEP